MNPSCGTILVVDDTPANLSLLLDALAGLGHRLLIAESGTGALSQLKHTVPDLILLDVIMPGLDGFATCEELRRLPQLAGVPVLFMTALDEPDQKVRAFQGGAVDYITKPVYVPEVLARVSAHLSIRFLQRSLEDELEMRREAENELSKSLDRAVLLVTPAGRIVFSTRLAENLLHRHCPGYQPGQLPAVPAGHPTLRLRQFEESGRDDLRLLVLEENDAATNPAALMKLGLTAREAEVLYWLSLGKSNPDIATILQAGLRTIHKHVEHIFQKLGVETRVAAAVTALEALRRR